MTELQKVLELRQDLQPYLFCRGFLFTDERQKTGNYPFWNNWQEIHLADYYLYVHSWQKITVFTQSDITCAMVGHAYNPFSMENEEKDILQRIIDRNIEEKISDVTSSFWRQINELTGIFTIFLIAHAKVYVIGDATGMQTTFYGQQNDKTYITSHVNLVGALLGLEWDPYIDRLTQYRFFHLFGNSLPGNLTQFKDMKRLIPNHYLEINTIGIKIKRFYWPLRLLVTEEQITNEVSTLLCNNMALISKKWEKPAISLTGGCDSKTTLACAKKYYDQYKYFSYISSDVEKVDAIAANKICNELKLKHSIYQVSEDDSTFPDLQTVSEILYWNTGSILHSHSNEVRKRILLSNVQDFDIEVKSWVSEIGRAYYSKRFNGRKNFGETPSPRKCTTLYKVFLNNRKLVQETDGIFEDYLSKFFDQSRENYIEWQEQFFWEFRMSSWNGIVITGEHRFSFDITIPYNNRRILELLLSEPIEGRIKDQIYTRIRVKMNPTIDQTGINIMNVKHTRKRARAENFYFYMNTHIPF